MVQAWATAAAATARTLDLTGTMEAWREKGVAPGRSPDSTAVGRSARCVPPQYAKYKGPGT